MYLITTDPFPEKTQLKLQFQLPGDDRNISVIAEVVWCREKDERPPFYPGMGLSFTEIKDEDRERIDRFVKGLLAGENKTAKQSTIQQ
jgi:Tfp pilus assembly protein PilZ